jgi:hypothetical protein
MKLLAASLLLFSACMVGDDTTDDPNAGDPGIDISADSVHSRVQRITTISYAPNSFVIGNAYSGWTDIIQGAPQFSHGPGNEGGAYYRWGYLYGENFDRCAWINNNDVDQTTSTHGANKCPAGQQINDGYFYSTFTNGEHNHLAGDGSVTHMQYDGSGCTDTRGFGNVSPWRSPATPANSVGTIPNGKELRWRYVTRDGKWVLVRDPAPPAGQPNWYFVHRGCVSVANLN